MGGGSGPQAFALGECTPTVQPGWGVYSDWPRRGRAVFDPVMPGVQVGVCAELVGVVQVKGGFWR